jgi:hypothetical protein
MRSTRSLSLCAVAIENDNGMPCLAAASPLQPFPHAGTFPSNSSACLLGTCYRTPRPSHTHVLSHAAATCASHGVPPPMSAALPSILQITFSSPVEVTDRVRRPFRPSHQSLQRVLDNVLVFGNALHFKHCGVISRLVQMHK